MAEVTPGAAVPPQEDGGMRRRRGKEQASSCNDENQTSTEPTEARQENQNEDSGEPDHVEDSESPDWHEKCLTIRIAYWKLAIGFLLMCLFAVIIALVVLIMIPRDMDFNKAYDYVEGMGGKASVDVFSTFDMNRDGYLSLYEFANLLPHLKNLTEVIDQITLVDKFLEYTPKPEEEVLVLHADFIPLELTSLTKEDIFEKDFDALKEKFIRLYLRFTRHTAVPLLTGKSSLGGLRGWTTVNREHEMFGASELRTLLPDDLGLVHAGQVYTVIDQDVSTFFGSEEDYSSARFYPRKPHGKEEILFRLLGMMHPRPFVRMRFMPRGTIACVQALSPNHIHVVLRMHAEFQLNQPPLRPFWFTPAQFIADIVMNREGTHVHYFHMEVPSERKLNVDMEWLQVTQREGDTGMEVDIGYMPRMEWTLRSQSALPSPAHGSQPDPPPVLRPEDVAWSDQVDRQTCLRSIERAFYPFKQVVYHNLTEAVQLSREQQKPLHAIFLWGALDDQSC